MFLLRLIGAADVTDSFDVIAVRRKNVMVKRTRRRVVHSVDLSDSNVVKFIFVKGCRMRKLNKEKRNNV